MDWYYFDGKNRFGPLNDAQFVEYVNAGKLIDSMLVWKPGMPGWESWARIRSLPEISTLPGIKTMAELSSAEPLVPCMSCGKVYPVNEVIPFEKGHICPACKPEFIQRLKEGAPLPGVHINPMDFAREIIHHDYELRIFDCIKRSFTLCRENFWLTVGAAVIIFMLLFVSHSLPCCLGIIAGLILTGPLVGGRFYFFIRLSRKMEIGIGEIFDGFKGNHFVPLMIAHIIKTLFYLPIILMVIGFFIFMSISDNDPFEGISAIVFLSLLGLSIPAFIYLSVSWIFTFPLIIDKGLPFWDAMKLSFKMVNKHWFKVFGLVLVSGILTWSGLILCIGLLFTLPIMYGALAYAYTDIFKG
jgi:hypothetical protein